MDKNVKNFLQDALIELIENKVSIKLLRKKRVKCGAENSESNGFFNELPLIFSCGMAKPQKDWIPTFLHEFCHFRQYKEDAEVWLTLKKSGSEEKFWSWLDFKIELSKIELKQIIQIIIEMELDCEKRVIRLVEDYNLDSYLNISEYIRSANAYIFFYNVVLKKRKWYEKAPYECEEIRQIVPNYFLDDYKVMPSEYEKMVIEYCF